VSAPSDSGSICAIIPAYQNGRTVADVVRRAMLAGLDLIVVDDGSTDGTGRALAGIGGIEVLTHPMNRGKGAALRSGFRRAMERGHEWAITLDADGQHDPAEIPRLVEAIRGGPRAVIVGARGMRAGGAPLRSHAGLALSNALVRVLAGKRLPDSQSGFRAYPLREVAALGLRARGFELEVEVLLKAAWAGLDIRHVPVSVRYPGRRGERASHFRPVRDTARILLSSVRAALARASSLPEAPSSP
jgi:glycosyltransferase involved in cell wall biosynthesis